MCFGSLWQTGQTGTTPVCPQGIDPNFQGTVFLPQLHGHVLMPDTNQTVCVCSVCKTSPNKGNAYRCKTCNFDCCAQCFSTVSAFSSWKLPPPPPPPLFPLASFRRFPSPPRFRQSQHSRANLPEAAKVASRLSFEAREKWTTDGMGSEVLVDVDPGSSEFGEIASALLCTLDNQSVVRIQRVENGAQHELFSVQLRNIARRLGAEFSPETMIRHIFHGTGKQALDRIIHGDEGFLPMLAGSRVGTAYGNGTYFATTAKFSDRYACNLPSGQKQMLLAEAVVGRWTLGEPGMKACPDVPGHPFQRYNSLVDDLTRPQIWVLLLSSQAYPAYLITYQSNLVR